MSDPSASASTSERHEFERPPKIPTTVKTRILIMADTHNFIFQNKSHTALLKPRGRPIPEADVLLICGDMTNSGSIPALEYLFDLLAAIPAEKKLIVAGNHDATLDHTYWLTCPEGRDRYAIHEQAMDMMTGQRAKRAGVEYLEEGIHKIDLKNGAIFTVYASPYTAMGFPAIDSRKPLHVYDAFRYENDQDRFNELMDVSRGMTSIGGKPIPDFPAVDIIMTHAAPYNVMDRAEVKYRDSSGNNVVLSQRVGCKNLLRADIRAKPRLHCFGHVHEGYGAFLGNWVAPTRRPGQRPANERYDLRLHNKGSLKNNYPRLQRCDVEFGNETLMVNASMANKDGDLVNPPWFIELDLPNKAYKGTQPKLPKTKFPVMQTLTKKGKAIVHGATPVCCVSNPNAVTQ
jgi:Calcineurin-like phosphoesterase